MSLTIMHLVACVVIFIGILMMAPKFTQEHSIMYKMHYGITWLVFLLALAVAIIGAVMASFQSTFVLDIITFALLILGMLLAAPKVFFNESSKSLLGTISWFFFTAGFILGLVGEFLSINSNATLHTITYGLIIIGFVILAPKFFKSSQNILAWLIFIIGLALEIISIRF